MLAAATGHPLPRRSLKKTAFQNRNARMGLLQIMLQKHILKIITVILTGLNVSETLPLPEAVNEGENFCNCFVKSFWNVFTYFYICIQITG